MISSIEITRFRGIREGKLEELTPLVILVGPNGCGKSSVLDALLIGASGLAVQAVGRAVQRHKGVSHGARWLLWKRGDFGPAEVTLTTSNKKLAHYLLNRVEESGDKRFALECQLDRGHAQKPAKLVLEFGDRNVFHVRQRTPLEAPFSDLPSTCVVEGHVDDPDSPLHEVFSEAVKQGRRDHARAIVKELMPNVKDILLLSEGDKPIVHLEYEGHSVPAALAGDGIYSLVRLSYELASRPSGAVLLEEPEVHQHPGAIRQTARAIWAAVRREIQVILTTHSLELIDSILAESSEEDLPRLSLYRLQLDDGLLKSRRMPGPEVAFARCEIEKDLR